MKGLVWKYRHVVQYVIVLRFFDHVTKRDPRWRRETIGEASWNVAEDALSLRFDGKEKVFEFICELDAIFELQEEFDAADDVVV